MFTDEQVESMAAILILNGDTPLLTEQTIEDLLSVHQHEQATVTVLTATLENPTGYGRVVRRSPANGGGESSSSVIRIVEDRDAQEGEAALREVNVGTYVVDASFLFDAVDRIAPDNAQQEYYLTDIVTIAVEEGRRVSSLRLEWAEEGLGINSRTHLVEAERIIRHRIVAKWLERGVTVHDPATTWIDADVRIGSDTVLYPHVTLEGHTRIGDQCTIRSHVRLTNCRIGHEVIVQDSCVAQEAIIEGGAVIGPFAHLRPGSVIRRKGKVGNFVEMKQAELGEGSKANHLTYLGNATIGRHVNIGAGSITCNYDGLKKYQTVIGDDVFVGSNTLFIAPVSVGGGALLAAGTTVTEDVPGNALAVGRAKQVNKKDWVLRRRALQASASQPVQGEGTDKRKKAKAKGKK